MSDVSLESVVSFLDVDDLTTVIEQIYGARGDRTKRVERDGRTFLFAASADERAPSEAVWVDATAEFSEHTVTAFAERCEDRAVAGTLITTGEFEQANETLAFAFATEEQLSEPSEDDDPETFEPELLVSADEIDVPIELVSLSELVEELEEHDMGEAIIDEYHEPYQQAFEDVLKEVDEEAAKAKAANEKASGGSQSTLVAIGVLAIVLVVLVVFVI